MFAIRNLISSQIPKNALQVRNMSGIAVPARNKISTGEKLFLAGAMVVSWLTIPSWVLVNIKNYREQN